jgi:hypothetical protein
LRAAFHFLSAAAGNIGAGAAASAGFEANIAFDFRVSGFQAQLWLCLRKIHIGFYSNIAHSRAAVAEEYIYGVFIAFGKPQLARLVSEIHIARSGQVSAAQINDQLVVHINPNIVIASEEELLPGFVSELGVALKAE